MNYFQLLGIEQKYDLDPKNLKQTYLRKQQEYHPDRAINDTIKKDNITKSMLINEAYKALSDELTRAEYLLKINDYILDDKTLSGKLSAGEFEAILDQYEIIDQIDELAELQTKKREKIAEKSHLITELTRLFNDHKLSKALDLTIRLKYLTKLVGNINRKIQYANTRD
ncbi:MAG: Fe-S protein assembly co-chaperone HscB [Rickettsiaceae bacterium]